MSMPDYNVVLDALVASMSTAMPGRHVDRNLVDPAQVKREKLLAGQLCVVSTKGGNFANYRGREAQLGQIRVSVVGYLAVPESSSRKDIERAELELLGDLLAWIASGSVGVSYVAPGDWEQSKQMEHPYGWLVLELVVKP